MSYLDKETGVDTAQPIELYEFIYPNQTYRYCTHIEEVTYLGQVWSPVALRRTNIKADNSKGLSPITFDCPKDFTPSVLYRSNSNTRILVKSYRVHIGDAEIFFQGQWAISNVSFNDTNSQIVVSSISTILQTEFPRYFYQFQCNHSLYSPECGVIPTNIVGLVVSVDLADSRNLVLNTIIPATAKLATILIGTERRLITTATGTTSISVLRPFSSVQVNDAFSAQDKGCDRSFATCTAVFSNGNRFGGMPYIPTYNVFSSGIS